MTNLVKSQWLTDGDSLRLNMPFAKVDVKNRLVSGWATLDNLDTQGDVVLAEASAKAFARARGNLREMHQSIAVGKIVDFREDEFFHTDPDTGEGKFYRGIFVTARVSEGAQDTWIKVLDGTLSGFSIGGSIIEASNEFVKDSQQTVRFIKDYDLIELSLVDNPANQLANVFSIQKAANGSVTVKGMVAETLIENVFYCANDEEIQSKTEDSANCLECGSKMENIGWFEAGNDRAEKVREIVTKFRSTADASKGGGTEMGKPVEKSETPVEETPEEETATATEEEVTEVEETVVGEEEIPAEVPEEVVDEEEAISKKIDELKNVVHDTLEKSRTETNETVKALEAKIDEINEAFTKKASELESKLDGFGEKLETAKGRLAGLEKSLDKMNSSEAFRKSSDLEPEEKIVQKSKTTWDGAFSVDNLL